MSTPQQLKERSKYLSKILRHQPESIRLQLDEAGWADVSQLLDNIARYGPAFNPPFDRSILTEIVATSDKQRYAFNADATRIRASQGHSIAVELGYTPQSPPEFLYHGTAQQNLDSIRKSGLVKGRRHHVHLSSNQETALRVGSRHGKAVVLNIRSGEMHRAGHAFFCTPNGVWLTDAVSAEFIE